MIENNNFLLLYFLLYFLLFTILTGIPELGVTGVEPIVIDEINLALGAGPDGYRATFKDVEAYGVSNLTVTNVR